MEKQDLNKILESHNLWLEGRQEGKCANLRGANLQNADLRGANLQNANLRYAAMRGANLQDADLRRADLLGAYLQDADLWGANLQNANLQDADLRGADLRGADLLGAAMRGADLEGAYLVNIKHNYLTVGIIQPCPEIGSYEAWKKCDDNKLVKLLIPEDAKRSSATTRKCRASCAICLEGEGQTVYQGHVTVYSPGKKVESFNGFNEDRWVECGEGIHHFVNKEDAESWE